MHEILKRRIVRKTVWEEKGGKEKLKGKKGIAAKWKQL